MFRGEPNLTTPSDNYHTLNSYTHLSHPLKSEYEMISSSPDPSYRNKSKHTNTKFCDYKDACLLVNDPCFNSIDEMGDVFEVDMRKRTLQHDIPVSIGFSIYQVSNLSYKRLVITAF